ncbi:MAG: gluconokinase, partial [Tomitella sp.]|nr:gluconokinase [Tomitella sp.]
MGANTSDPRPGPSDQVRPDGATGPDGITEPDEATKPDDATSTRDAAEPDAAISAGDAAAAAVPASTLILMGVSGSGKTTVASLLADRLGRRLLEGDEMHSAEAIEKMASGHPLDDEDRWPWLRRIRAWIETQAEAEQSGIIACSALKHSYRDLLADGGGVVFVYLHVGRAEL